MEKIIFSLIIIIQILSCGEKYTQEDQPHTSKIPADSSTFYSDFMKGFESKTDTEICQMWISGDSKITWEYDEEFSITIEKDSTGKTDTVISGNLKQGIIFLMGERNKLVEQVNAAEELLQTMNCSYQPNDSMHREFLLARKKWWISRGWDTTRLKDNCCCK